MLKVSEILEASGGTVASMGDSEFSGVSTDSRTIRRGEMFVPIKGERFDGHDFVRDALATGSGAIVNSAFGLQYSPFEGKTIILVNDTLTALQDLARHLRKQFNGRVLGIVGSNGKTTTKELTASILGTKLRTVKTVGNLNNQIGMPLSLVNGAAREAGAGEGAMVLELGTNRPGDIDELCNISAPDIGVVTNIGYEHLEGFGSLEKVRESELEIMPYVKELILNGDDSFLMEGVKRGSAEARKDFEGRTITFGIDSRKADVVARRIVFSDETTSFSLCAGGDSIDIDSRLPGRFNVYNSLAAASAALALGFGLGDIKKGLESFGGVDMRFEVKRLKGSTFLNDIYNANPSSMEESLRETARRFREGGHRYKRAVAVLGDMLELGAYAEEEHRKLGRRLSEFSIDVLIGAGPLMEFAVSEFGGKGISTAGSEEAGRELAGILGESDLVLIKGSRGMKMEKVLSVLEREGA